MGLSPVNSVPAARRLGLAVLVLGSLAGFGVLAGTINRWWGRQAPPPVLSEDVPPDPRLTYSGPFLNVRPDVRYVGDAACAGCHPIKDRTFHQHPMGRSIVPMPRMASSELYRQPTPFEKFGSQFFLDRRGSRVWNRQRLRGPQGEPVAEFDSEIHYVIGSGRRGHSYLSVREGRVYQTSISWYAQKKKWDLSPSFRGGGLREIYPSCLFCHSGGVRPVKNTMNLYEEPVFINPAIGCERCHGPGALHVKSRGRDELPAGPIDPTIVNPRHLRPELKEQVCQQCHLEGTVRILRRGRGLFDYRPGLPLDEFLSIYVATREEGEPRKAVGHVEQMHESKCFTASRGKMGCTTCHDPHEQVEDDQRVPHYRRKCLDCHAKQHPCTLDRAARLAKSKQDSCIDCHMQRFQSADIVHTATTDHSIPRRPGRILERHASPGKSLVHFHGRPVRLNDTDACRDMGLALTLAAAKNEGAGPEQLRRALDLLDLAASRVPNDVTLLVGLADCLKLTGHPDQALAALQRVLALEPEHEWTLREAAHLSLALGQLEDALTYNRRAAGLNPRYPDTYFLRALIYLRKRDWQEALAAAREMLRLEPTLAQPYLIQAYCYEQLGDRTRAARAREKLAAVKTPDKALLLEMFDNFRRK